MTRVAYLISEYPAHSHTFIRREIEALRARGLVILPISVRRGRCGDGEEVPSILGTSLPQALFRASHMLLTRPWRGAQTWVLAQRHRALGFRGLVWAQFHFVEALVLAAMLNRAGANRLHSHFANSGATVGMLAANLLQKPWSLTLHGISETDPPAGSLLQAKIERADFVACASWFMRAQGMRVVGPEHWPKMHVVRCGVDLARLSSAVQPQPNAPIRFVTVGRIAAEKGYPGLLEGLKAVIDAGIDAELTIIGDGPLRKTLEREILSRGLQERVLMRGALPEDEAIGAIAASDIFVLASLMEGLPVVLMEAMALSKPVIAACVAGIPELVRENENGLLFRPGDWSHLSVLMLSLARDPILRMRLSGGSRQRIENEYDINRAVEPLIALFGHETRKVQTNFAK